MFRLFSGSARTKVRFRSKRFSSQRRLHSPLEAQKFYSVSMTDFFPETSIPAVTQAATEIITKNVTNTKKRKRFSYQENHTAALALSASIDELTDNMHNANAMLEIAKRNMLEHAARRIDLFFYVLIAYYKSGRIPEHGRTKLQYGKGRNTVEGQNITQACHSSFFGTIDDVGYNQASLLYGTHLWHSLNATVELPAFVNMLDDELEAMCRTQSLNIIRQVSLGMINPIEGLNKFFVILERAFSDIEHRVKISKKATPFLLRANEDCPQKAKIQLIQLIKDATFGEKWNSETKQIEDEYIEMMLRLTTKEKIACQFGEEIRDSCYERQFQALQQEILIMEEQEEEMAVESMQI